MNLSHEKSVYIRRSLRILAFALIAVGARAQVTTNIWEDFANIPTNYSATTDIGASLNTYTHTAGWTGSKVYNGTNMVKMGSSSALGTITTPALDLSANGGGATVTFTARRWANDATAVRVSLDGVQQGADLTLTTNQTAYQVSMAGGTTTSKVTFAGNGSSNRRFFLDDIVIYQDATLSDPPQILIVAPTAVVAYAVTTVTLNGTANTNVIGDISWTNAAASAQGAIAAATNWSVADIPLAVGTNLLVVAGTNATGVADIRTTSVVRVSAGYLAVPALGPATGIDATFFTANWSNALNASGYLLDASANPAFSTNTALVIRRDSFESGWNGWTATSTVGAAQSWVLTNGLGLGGSTAPRMNGYSTTDSNEDWLLSPALDLSTNAQPAFSFMSALHYGGPALQVFVSTNYVEGMAVDDLLVEWIPLAANFGPTGYVWTASGDISLADYRGGNVHLAFKYTSSAGTGNALAIALDDVQVREMAVDGGATDFLPGFRSADAGASLALQVTGLVEAATYYYRVQAYNTAATGTYSSIGRVLTVAADLPLVTITTPATNLPYATSTFDLVGTANGFTVGWLSWTNSLGGGGAVPSAAGWTIGPIALSVGTNHLTVVGTNSNARASTSSVAVVRFPNNVLVSESFDGGTNAPSGWAFTNIVSAYTSSGFYGASSPALQLATNSSATTKTFVNGTNVSFWIRGTGTPVGRLVVLQYDGATWTELLAVTNPSASAATYNVGLATNVVQLQFLWEKTSGNIALDDVVVTGYEPGSGPGPVADIGIVSFVRAGGTQVTLAWTGATASCSISVSTNLTTGFTPQWTGITTNTATVDMSGFGPPVYLRVEQ